MGRNNNNNNNNNNKKIASASASASTTTTKLSVAQMDILKTLQQDGASIKVSRFTNNSYIDTGSFSLKLNMRTMDVLISKGLLEYKETTLNHNIYGLTDAGKNIQVSE